MNKLIRKFLTVFSFSHFFLYAKLLKTKYRIKRVTYEKKNVTQRLFSAISSEILLDFNAPYHQIRFFMAL